MLHGYGVPNHRRSDHARRLGGRVAPKAPEWRGSTVGGGGFEWMTPNYIGSPANSCNPFSQAFGSGSWSDCYGAGTKYLITDTP